MSSPSTPDRQTPASNAGLATSMHQQRVPPLDVAGPPLYDLDFVNPFVGILSAASDSGAVQGIKHTTVLEAPRPMDKPADLDQSDSTYYNAAGYIEVNHHLSVLLPQVIALEGPEPLTDYNAIMREAYRRWGARIERFCYAKHAEPRAVASGEYKLKPAPKGIDWPRHCMGSFVTWMEKVLIKKDAQFRQLLGDDRKAALGKTCLKELKEWSTEWQAELDLKERRYQRAQGRPSAIG
ncbi:uncharacterized protein HMPREF1541_02334 [Cyphellophora europaea CBS 101466]|uniref:Uncharacterized protein n=1 Tax=Cyphellophora europaea (strain CBS 101466) TaxID=1220924 RepID=W2S381_CYPE1|nr:uncharacterized protein HMPREF1541_02334 [Cyphellophora europaea CBS 101466]ETN43176.1 hypothetical protein HMPREF1541_02334 [Cyphellophora europaea CBS 101466]